MFAGEFVAMTQLRYGTLLKPWLGRLAPINWNEYKDRKNFLFLFINRYLCHLSQRSYSFMTFFWNIISEEKLFRDWGRGAGDGNNCV